MKNPELLQEMKELLSQSEAKIRNLGVLVSSAHQPGSEATFQHMEATKSEILSLQQQWLEKYNMFYHQNS